MKRQTLTINSVEFELFKVTAGMSVKFTGFTGKGTDYDEIRSAYGRRPILRLVYGTHGAIGAAS